VSRCAALWFYSFRFVQLYWQHRHFFHRDRRPPPVDDPFTDIARFLAEQGALPPLDLLGSGESDGDDATVTSLRASFERAVRNPYLGRLLTDANRLWRDQAAQAFMTAPPKSPCGRFLAHALFDSNLIAVILSFVAIELVPGSAHSTLGRRRRPVAVGPQPLSSGPHKRLRRPSDGTFFSRYHQAGA